MDKLGQHALDASKNIYNTIPSLDEIYNYFYPPEVKEEVKEEKPLQLQTPFNPFIKSNVSQEIKHGHIVDYRGFHR